MKVITTHFYKRTKTKGDYVKAYHCFHDNESSENSVLSYDFGLTEEQMHFKVAEALQHKLGLKGKLVGGKSRDGYAYVLLEDK